MNWKFNMEKTRVVLDKPPRSPKKITAGRIGSILGMNPWKSPFNAWCEITRVYSESFEDNKYTLAGKAIEPIIIKWAKEQFGKGVMSPEEYFGNTWDTVKKKYDFYPDVKIFGGMWDALVVSNSGDIIAVIEIKTTSRPQDWEEGVPDEKHLQALLYSYLLKVKRTFVITAFLDEKDYMNPHRFIPVEGKNIKMYSSDTNNVLLPFDGEMCNIEQLVDYARQWWEAYVMTGISPDFSAKKDSDILRVLKTQKPDEDEASDLSMIVSRLNTKEAELAYVREQKKLDDLENEIKSLKDALKRKLTEGMGEDDEIVEIDKWTLTKSTKKSVDTKKMQDDGIYENYLKFSETYTLKHK